MFAERSAGPVCVMERSKWRTLVRMLNVCVKACAEVKCIRRYSENYSFRSGEIIVRCSRILIVDEHS